MFVDILVKSKMVNNFKERLTSNKGKKSVKHRSKKLTYYRTLNAPDSDSILIEASSSSNFKVFFHQYESQIYSILTNI